ncbi:MAG: TetR family transcriptional regulator [Moraxellaceae bacterium]|jgi:AcrR family transcriptional regulator|nr:TetR family transcriptional regulator [Moraxellaceae bacterium]
MARKPQQQRSKATVDAIIQAGFICVAERGIVATTTRHIADTAGIGVGSLYEYFKDKEAVFDAMNQRMVEEVVAMLQTLAPQITRLPIGEAVKLILSHFGDFLQRNDQRYLKCSRQAMNIDIKDYVGPISRLLMEIVMQHVMHHPEHMRLRHIPAMSYIFINGGIFSVVRHLSDPNPPISYEELTQGLADMVSHYVAQELLLTAPAPR